MLRLLPCQEVSGGCYDQGNGGQPDKQPFTRVKRHPHNVSPVLSENIRAVRKAKGLSQEELAIKLNVVRQTISKWEQGLSVPDSDLLIAIAQALETPVSTLLGEKDRCGRHNGRAQGEAQPMEQLSSPGLLPGQLHIDPLSVACGNGRSLLQSGQRRIERWLSPVLSENIRAVRKAAISPAGI